MSEVAMKQVDWSEFKKIKQIKGLKKQECSNHIKIEYDSFICNRMNIFNKITFESDSILDNVAGITDIDCKPYKVCYNKLGFR